jgi:hypothetical protein
VPGHLAYVEWFSSLPATPEAKHSMYKISRLLHNGQRVASIIPVESIIGSVHVIPRMGPVVPPGWSSFTVLDKCQTFYVNPFTDERSYLTF